MKCLHAQCALVFGWGVVGRALENLSVVRNEFAQVLWGRLVACLMERCRRRDLLTSVDAAASELEKLRASARTALQLLRKRSRRTLAASPPHRLILLAAACCCLESDAPVLVLVMRVLWRSWKHGRGLSNVALAELLENIRADETLIQDSKALLSGRGGARLLLRLGRLVAEARLAMWLVSVNTQGVAVNTAQLVAKLRALWPPAARGWQCDAFLARVRQWPRRRKAYAKTFRLRWGVTWRRLPSRANLEPTDLLFRVPRAKFRDNFRCHKVGPFLVPIFGATLLCYSTEGSFVGTESGPTKRSPFFVHWRYARSSRGRSGCSTRCSAIGSA